MVASAIKNQALTSSIAAQPIVREPTGPLSIRRSVRIRASTGKAVIDIATPMNSANAANFMFGPRSLYSGSAAAMPSSIGSAMLALEIAAAGAALPFSCFWSTSMPIRNMKKISPRFAATPNAGRMSVEKIVACRLGASRPNSEGPSAIPAITSPITRGWPTRTATIPNARATISTISTARKNAATSLVNELRCLVAVNCSPDGGRPEVVISAGLAAALEGVITTLLSDSDVPCAALAAGFNVVRSAALTVVLAADGTGVATCSGISLTFCSRMSFAVAVRRTEPPFVHARSPLTALVLVA